MTTFNPTEISSRLYHKILSFKEIMTKAQILDFIAEDLPKDVSKVSEMLDFYKQKDKQIQIDAINSLISLRQYLAQFADDQLFYRYQLTSSIAVDIKMIGLSKSFPVSDFKQKSDDAIKVNSVSITPYSEVELLEMALQVAKEIALSKSKAH